MVDNSSSPFQSPVVPEMYDGDKKISFACYKGIQCFNACCKSIDITLTPYDIVRLKQRLGMTSWDFLREYTVPYELEKDGIAAVKFKTRGETTECQFMTEEGCSVYEDRPTACRYYPVALIAMRRQDEYTDTNSFAVVKEEHCLGHREERELTIDEYRAEQGLEDYDELARGWRQLILKKKSSGPAIGKPSLRSRQLFFMASYDMDRFREFVRSEGFHRSFKIDDELYQTLLEDDVELMKFGSRFLQQVLFGEETIPVTEEAREALEERERQAAREQAESSEEKAYDPASEPVDIA
ncbi:YkgJ family cysteine cluster protein [Thiohalomonas denitrificans]|uniref:Uncharacterized protein n=1 Tax=Thiohalomonas denitrificans TaxID=415747 RepID=A0A1G5PSD6_9GAMM|nr:YkgJ family cysteine cluster protein [Thiohalomonas denitrificans]SCZ52372.1 hypothetical protein SAMN03097708_00738 [Thiohalomonas denitrificans]